MKPALARAMEIFQSLTTSYAEGSSDLDGLGSVGAVCVQALEERCSRCRLKLTVARGADRQYDVFSDGTNVSRGFRADLFMPAKELREVWGRLAAQVKERVLTMTAAQANSAIYTHVMSFCCLIDLVARASRKTPGTLFELTMGMLLSELSGRRRGKQVRVEGERYTVPTDLVLFSDDEPLAAHLVVASKISTRERVVQAYAQQRILEEIYPGQYKSILVAANEMNMQGTGAIHETCVPNQIGLFQKYLAQLAGIYYLDPPRGYVEAPFNKPTFSHPLPVRTIGDLLVTDLAKLLEE